MKITNNSSRHVTPFEEKNSSSFLKIISRKRTVILSYFLLKKKSSLPLFLIKKFDEIYISEIRQKKTITKILETNLRIFRDNLSIKVVNEFPNSSQLSESLINQFNIKTKIKKDLHFSLSKYKYESIVFG